MTPVRDDRDPLDAPMRPADDSMPPRERMVREFLARYRAPGGEWTEGHVAHVLRRMAVLPLRGDE